MPRTHKARMLHAFLKIDNDMYRAIEELHRQWPAYYARNGDLPEQLVDVMHAITNARRELRIFYICAWGSSIGKFKDIHWIDKMISEGKENARNL